MKVLVFRFFILFIFINLSVSTKASSIEFFQIEENGKIKLITEEVFDQCPKITYRKPAGSLLPLKHKKKLLKATLKGETINSWKILSKKNGHCSYKLKEEVFAKLN